MSSATSLGYLGQMVPTLITAVGTTTVTFPNLANGVKIGLVGGGGGGSGRIGVNGGGGGAPGQYIEFMIFKSASIPGFTLNIGDGGVGGVNFGGVGGSSTCSFNRYNGGLGGTFLYYALGGTYGYSTTGGVANSSSLPSGTQNYIAYGGLSGGTGTISSTFVSGSGSEGMPYMSSYLGYGSGGYGGNGDQYHYGSAFGANGRSGCALLTWF